MSIKDISSSEQKLAEALEQEHAEKRKSPTLKTTGDEQEGRAQKKAGQKSIGKGEQKSVKNTSSEDTTIPRYRDTTTPRHHATTTPSMVATVRKAVILVGKEAATHRFTPEEKRAIADMVYTYGRQGYKTSENEIARIAINWLILDYEENGTKSILETMLKALKE